MHRYEKKLKQLQRSYSRHYQIMASVWSLLFVGFIASIYLPMASIGRISGFSKQFEIVFIGLLAVGNIASETHARRLAGEVIEVLRAILDDDRENAKVATNALQAE